MAAEVAIEKRSRSVEAIQGVSAWSEQVRRQIERYAPFQTSVLVTGPSGTGKELIARSLHAASPHNENRIPVDRISCPRDLRLA